MVAARTRQTSAMRQPQPKPRPKPTLSYLRFPVRLLEHLHRTGRARPQGRSAAKTSLRPLQAARDRSAGGTQGAFTMAHIDQLRVYQLARATCASAYRLAAGVPDPALRDQIRRAAASVVLNIAEGRGRNSDADFARFLAMARGSNCELTAQLAFAVDAGLLEPHVVATVCADLELCGRMLSAFITRLRGT